ncbi:PP2C family protein-serine/threonine phosphatase [Azospirillum picis]|uniref:Sigma-B regulation protein RsbU (Phosphoserine phosphatase) n=1 Tax=Azospirillum picis TaxID=488438 RepID=A0ABU0MKL8_9PROT|nr:fused response regulator/phosphatase [Azospirillum picis]MBP2300160.1 sigma-B regulation protein RsbU (phosphoserine phosphatase) [Azospirillum picis]MDQ0533998.1 sigma-B regulation protein RsbU (phosphoserine phosphatase) [Azospirillum picis]
MNGDGPELEPRQRPRSEPGRETASPAAEADQLTDGIAGARVLIVDDNRINRHLLLALLERGGITSVEQAEDGDDALACMERFKPDLVLLDLMMPQLDGFEMCRRLRADPRWRSLPVLAQSSLNRVEDRIRAFAAGATDYVTKPINAVELLARVRIHIRKHLMLRDLERYHSRTRAELMLARSMQERLLPSPSRLAELEAETGVAVQAHFAPSSELGGDFWGIQTLPGGRIAVYLVDFSGHGVGAALNTFRLDAICRQADSTADTPAAFLAAVNRRLCRLLPTGQFATMLAGLVDPVAGVFRYASAGSTAPMLWLPGDEAPRLGDGSGLPLGLLASASYEDRELPLPPGARLFLYSDAAIEIPTGGQEGGHQVLDDTGLAALLAGRMRDPDGARLLAGLVGDLHAAGPIDDDLTALLLTRRG